MKLIVKAQYRTGKQRKDPSKTYEGVQFEATDENGKVYEAFVFPKSEHKMDDVTPLVFNS